MAIDVETTMQALSGMTTTALQARYAEVFGEPTRSFHKQHLIRRIIWRMQSLDEGGLSERARRRALELANDADLRVGPPRATAAAPSPQSGAVVEAAFRSAAGNSALVPGMLLRREYKDRVILVRVLHRGFDFEGEVYRSLSAVAKKVTGSHWNGHLFFGLKPARKEDA